jgi:hypothetical protein
MQRNKGAGGERELCALFTDYLGTKVTRNLGQARDSGHDITLAPFHVECKRRQRIGNLYDWISQAVDPDSPHRTPVVAMRADGQRWLVAMYFDDWIRIVREEIVAHNKGGVDGKHD